MFKIVSDAINFNETRKELSNPRAGALVVFEGWVRNHHEGKDVLKLEYDAYENLCVKEADKIEKECFDKFDILQLNCVHRTGVCEIKDMAVWVGATAEHRGEAFRACEYYIDNLKVRLPIWKKEYFTEGEPIWVRCEECLKHAHGIHDNMHKKNLESIKTR
jgi:molybdopterin synthase catalytic subunit